MKPLKACLVPTWTMAIVGVKQPERAFMSPKDSNCTSLLVKSLSPTTVREDTLGGLTCLADVREKRWPLVQSWTKLRASLASRASLRVCCFNSVLHDFHHFDLVLRHRLDSNSMQSKIVPYSCWLIVVLVHPKVLPLGPPPWSFPTLCHPGWCWNSAY